MSINEYFKIDKPEEKKEIETKQDSMQTINAAFCLWKSFLLNHLPVTSQDYGALTISTLDRVFAEAKEILSKYELPDKLEDPAYFALELPESHASYLGLFYSAILSVKDCIMVVPREMPFLGYRMGQGILEITPEKEAACYATTGGCIINRGTPHSLGHYAEGGFFVNYGHVRRSPFLGSDLGHYALGGIFVDYFYPQYDIVYLSAATFIVPRLRAVMNSKHLCRFGKKLEELVDNLHSATKEKTDYGQVRLLKTEIESHCSQYYGSR